MAGVNNYQATAGDNDFAQTVTISSYAVGSESDRVLVVHGTHTTSDGSFTHTATWDGNSMTLVRSREDLNSGIYVRSTIFEYLNPSNATGDIVLTISGATGPDKGVQAVYLDGVLNQTAESENDAEDLSEPCEVTLSTLSTGAICIAGIVGEASAGDITAWTANTGTTLSGDLEFDADNNVHAGLGYLEADAASETLGFNHSATSLLTGTLTAAAWEPTSSGFTITAEGGSYTVTGTDANLEFHRAIDAEAGSYAWTGSDATLTYGGNVIVAESGAFTITGTDANLEYGYDITAEGGSYTVTGTDAGFGLVRLGDPGVFTITGTDANLTLGGGTITAESGTFTVSGSLADLYFDRDLTAEGGSYAVTGTDADFLNSKAIEAEATTYSWTGSDATLTYVDVGVTIDVESGTYTITGSDATLTPVLIQALTLTADAGTYEIAGGAVLTQLTFWQEQAVGSATWTEQ